MVVKGSVTEVWFSGVLRSFLGWVLAKVRRKRGGGSPRNVGEKKVCKREGSLEEVGEKRVVSAVFFRVLQFW